MLFLYRLHRLMALAAGAGLALLFLLAGIHGRYNRLMGEKVQVRACARVWVRVGESSECSVNQHQSFFGRVCLSVCLPVNYAPSIHQHPHTNTTPPP